MNTNNNIQDVFSVTQLQAGMLFHDLDSQNMQKYLQQYAFHVQGVTNINLFTHAWMCVFKRHPALRTSFHWEGLSKPLQVIHKSVIYPLLYKDIRSMNAGSQKQYFLGILIIKELSPHVS